MAIVINDGKMDRKVREMQEIIFRDFKIKASKKDIIEELLGLKKKSRYNRKWNKVDIKRLIWDIKKHK